MGWYGEKCTGRVTAAKAVELGHATLHEVSRGGELHWEIREPEVGCALRPGWERGFFVAGLAGVPYADAWRYWTAEEWDAEFGGLAPADKLIEAMA